MIGNLVGTGKNDGGSSSSNKLYCVTINNDFSFYSSVPISTKAELKSYIDSKGLIRVFGTKGNISNTQYRIDLRYSVRDTESGTSFSLFSNVVKGSFVDGLYNSGSVYQGIEVIDYSTEVTSIRCYEV